MTAEEWDTCTDPADMLDALASLGYPAAAIRGAAVRVLKVTPESAKHLGECAWNYGMNASCNEHYELAEMYSEAADAQRNLLNPDCPDPAVQFRNAQWGSEIATPPADYIREQFPNPLRSVPLVHTAWLTSDVVALARGIRAEKAFDRMPVLADALMDADCHNEDVLGHCRQQDKPHHDGCWVLTLLLGADEGAAGSLEGGSP